MEVVTLKYLTSRIFTFGFLILSIIGYNACDDRMKYIDGYGHIVGKESCTHDGKTGWIVNLNMSKTTLPNSDMVLPLESDTINGTRYDALVRVFCNIQEPDSIISSREFSLKMHPLTTVCESSHKLSNYDTEDNYGYSKE